MTPANYEAAIKEFLEWIKDRHECVAHGEPFQNLAFCEGLYEAENEFVEILKKYGIEIEEVGE